MLLSETELLNEYYAAKQRLSEAERLRDAAQQFSVVAAESIAAAAAEVARIQAILRADFSYDD